MSSLRLDSPPHAVADCGVLKWHVYNSKCVVCMDINLRAVESLQTIICETTKFVSLISKQNLPCLDLSLYF